MNPPKQVQSLFMSVSFFNWPKISAQGVMVNAGRDDSLKSPTCVDLVNNCPNLSSLSLRGFKLHDYKVRILVKVCTNFMLFKMIALLVCSSGACLMEIILSNIQNSHLIICNCLTRFHCPCCLIFFPLF